MLELIAQAASPSAGDMINELVPQLSFGAVLVWYLLYNTKVTIPLLNKSNNDLVAGIVADHREVVKDLTDRFDANLKEERKIRQQEMQDLTSAIREIRKP